MEWRLFAIGLISLVLAAGSAWAQKTDGFMDNWVWDTFGRGNHDNAVEYCEDNYKEEFERSACLFGIEVAEGNASPVDRILKNVSRLCAQTYRQPVSLSVNEEGERVSRPLGESITSHSIQRNSGNNLSAAWLCLEPRTSASQIGPFNPAGTEEERQEYHWAVNKLARCNVACQQGACVRLEKRGDVEEGACAFQGRFETR